MISSFADLEARAILGVRKILIRMTQLDEAIARYHKLLQSEQYRDLAWAEALQQQMQARNLVAGSRPISPVLRPHFLTRRQYDNLAKAAESLISAITRIEQIALSNPALLSRMQLLPAEKMLAALDPGYPYLFVTSQLDTHVNNGTLRFVEHTAETPAGVAYGESLGDVFYDSPPVREFRRKYKYKLTKLGGVRYLLQALLKTYKEFGGKAKRPHIAILEFRQPFQTSEPSEFRLLAEFFRREGVPTEILSPDQLEYHNGQLRSEGFPVDLIYRRIKVQEFLVRFDLSHPLVRACKDRAVCLVNSFRSELGEKKAMFDLLTDEAVTTSFPAAERKAIREFIPWTRVVTDNQTTFHSRKVNLPEFILKHREKLILKPNDDGGDFHSFRGSELDESAWEKALKQAMRTPYVVQEVIEPIRAIFPVLEYGALHMREMRVDVQPHAFLGKVQGCSSWLTAGGPAGFSTVAGLAPTFILENK